MFDNMPNDNRIAGKPTTTATIIFSMGDFGLIDMFRFSLRAYPRSCYRIIWFPGFVNQFTLRVMLY